MYPVLFLDRIHSRVILSSELILSPLSRKVKQQLPTYRTVSHRVMHFGAATDLKQYQEGYIRRKTPVARPALDPFLKQPANPLSRPVQVKHHKLGSSINPALDPDKLLLPVPVPSCTPLSTQIARRTHFLTRPLTCSRRSKSIVRALRSSSRPRVARCMSASISTCWCALSVCSRMPSSDCHAASAAWSR